LLAGLTDAAIAAAVATVPAAWWEPPPGWSATRLADAFAARLQARRDVASRYLEEAERARAGGV
ncbi:MAG: hypothetical protein JNK56_30105, partial [Myxococcales bacterium]|nr:hypothetical protein [Myxococcales bacterium]